MGAEDGLEGTRGTGRGGDDERLWEVFLEMLERGGGACG